MIKVQQEDFNQEHLMEQLQTEAGNNAGAICTFTGLVRETDVKGQPKLIALSLEYYPGMTEKALAKIAENAKSSFELSAVIIIHRVGKLAVGDKIVYVGVASKHRKLAFEGCQFIMDYLKNDAPFWKKEYREDHSESWIEQKKSDLDAAKNW